MLMLVRAQVLAGILKGAIISVQKRKAAHAKRRAQIAKIVFKPALTAVHAMILARKRIKLTLLGKNKLDAAADSLTQRNSSHRQTTSRDVLVTGAGFEPAPFRL